LTNDLLLAKNKDMLAQQKLMQERERIRQEITVEMEKQAQAFVSQ
jgi:hypothetical protein